MAFGLGLRAAGYLARLKATHRALAREASKQKEENAQRKGWLGYLPMTTMQLRGYRPQQPWGYSSQRRNPRCCYTHQAPCGYSEEAGTLLAVSWANTSTEQGPGKARDGRSYLERGSQGRYSQISGASSEPSGQSLSPSHRQPFEIQVI